MDPCVPACSCSCKSPALQENKPISELTETTETTVISTICQCGHLFHLTCIKNAFSDEAMHCQNMVCAQNIERKQLEEVNIETSIVPDTPSAANLEEITDSCKPTEKADDTKVAQTTDIIKPEEQIIIISSQFENVKKESLKLLEDNKKLRSRNEKYYETIKKLKLHKSKLKDVVQKSILLVNRNNELKTKNEEYVKTISELKQRNSELERFENQNLLLVDQIKELRSKNDKCVEFIKKLQKFIDTKAIDEIFTDFENEVVNGENEEIRNVVSNIKMESIDENIVVVDEYYHEEESAQTLSSDETDADKIPKWSKVSSTVNELDGQQKIPTICRSFSLSSQRTLINREVEKMEQKIQNEVERCELRENDRRDHCNYQDRESKKRTSHEAHRPEYGYSPDKDAKRQKRIPSPNQEPLRPFSFTGHTFGPFSQVVYEGEFAYASGEYLLLGDGVINGVLRKALHNNRYFSQLMNNSPYYFTRRSIRKLNYTLDNLPYLPNKVMISIGDFDSATNDCSYFDLKESLQSLFYILYHKGVKKCVMIPPVKHNNWQDRRYHLDVFLRLQAGTKYDWDYYYMQELSEVMSKFTNHVQNGFMYYILWKDMYALSDKIVSYTTGKTDEEAEAETVS